MWILFRCRRAVIGSGISLRGFVKQRADGGLFLRGLVKLRLVFRERGTPEAYQLALDNADVASLRIAYAIAVGNGVGLVLGSVPARSGLAPTGKTRLISASARRTAGS